jgi:serine/threonine protein phosphatase 1
LDWLKSRPASWQTGNVAVVHAGADPTVPIYDQSVKTLYWGHSDFTKKRRRDGVWVVHGHTIVDAPEILRERIAIDTGAYATGRLSAVHVDQANARFETVTVQR